MSKRHSLHRLHELRCAEEEQRRALLTSALGELERLKTKLSAAREHKTNGRALLEKSIWSGDRDTRLGALEEIGGAGRVIDLLGARINAARNVAERFRADLLAARQQRQQTETLLDSIKKEQEAEQRRRIQTELDESYLLRKSAVQRANVRGEVADHRYESRSMEEHEKK